MDNINKYETAQKSPSVDLGVFNPSFHYIFCPRCSAKGTFINESNSFKCPVCGFNFFLNSAAAVTALIFNDEGDILIVKRGIDPFIGMLDLPGGFVDPGESVEEAILREIKEELDLVPSYFSFYGSFPNQYLFSGTIVFTVDMVFICTVDDFSTLKSMDDVSGVEFINLKDIDLDLVAFVSAKNILNRLKNERSHS
jgi:NAD+ diphosphatase